MNRKRERVIGIEGETDGAMEVGEKNVERRTGNGRSKENGEGRGDERGEIWNGRKK